MDNIIFNIKKPSNWVNLPLYKKINYYKSKLNINYTKYVDKLSAKDIVYSLCNSNCKIPKVIRILKNPKDLQESDINDNYLIKTSHGSSWLIDPKSKKDRRKNIEKLESWNKVYSYSEKQYINIKPRFFIEEKIICYYNGLTGNALDVKVFCFHGIPKFILVRNNNKRYFYDIDWKPIKPIEFIIEKPILFNNILDISTKLSKPLEFVRIDLYIGIDGIYFSEFTFTPRDGKQEFTDEIELEFGKYWLI
jgi:hypothetical protein